jgi:hypothetical protein
LDVDDGRGSPRLSLWELSISQTTSGLTTNVFLYTNGSDTGRKMDRGSFSKTTDVCLVVETEVGRRIRYRNHPRDVL